MTPEQFQRFERHQDWARSAGRRGKRLQVEDEDFSGVDLAGASLAGVHLRDAQFLDALGLEKLWLDWADIGSENAPHRLDGEELRVWLISAGRKNRE